MGISHAPQLSPSCKFSLQRQYNRIIFKAIYYIEIPLNMHEFIDSTSHIVVPVITISYNHYYCCIHIQLTFSKKISVFTVGLLTR